MNTLKLRQTVVVIALLFSFSVYTQTVDSNYVDGILYVKVYDTSTMDLQAYTSGNVDLDQLISDHSITNMYRSFKTNTVKMQKIFKVHFGQWANADSLINGFEAQPYIEYAEKAPIYYLNYVPDDYNTSEQWFLDKIDADEAWNGSTGSASVVVAVVDNALALNHEDLSANIWVNQGETPDNGIDDDLNGYTDDVNGYDVADGDPNPSPPSGLSNTDSYIHGTHVAGIVSASTDNGTGISSLGYSLSIMPVKCSEDATAGNSFAYAYEGVDYAIANNADIINMSFGSSQTFTTWDILIQTAQTKGIFMVGAAGNDDTTQLHYPAAYPYVFSVGATDINDKKATFSNYGNWIDVMAPGLGIKSTLIENDNTYGSLNGTSMSAPLVSALGGLLWSVDPGLSVSEVKDYIKTTCLDIDSLNTNYQGQLGSGRIDAYKTLAQLFPANITDKKKSAAEELVIYPNPANDLVNISFSNEEKMILEVYQLSGKLVYRQPLMIPSSQLNVSEFESGMYVVKLIGKDSSQLGRFVVQ